MNNFRRGQHEDDDSRVRPTDVAAFLAMITAGATSAWADAAEGKAVYEKQCKTCHSVAGEGGKMASTGGALDGVGAKRDEA